MKSFGVMMDERPRMKVFRQMQIREAEAFALAGGIAIHLHYIVFSYSPGCFKRDVAKGLPIAHVVCTDAEVLRKLAKRLGVNIIVIDREGQKFQHVDLCGKPLERLMVECGDSVQNHKRDNDDE